MPYLFDSLTNKKQEIQNKKQNLYLCGPTVYDDIHLGNLRPVIIFDFLIRLFKEKNIDYQYIQNITDIDDKIIFKAKEINQTEEFVSNKYKERFFSILKTMNIIPPHEFPCVTDHIDHIIEVINELISTGAAYEENGNVLFDLSKSNHYMELSKQRIEKLQTEENDHNFVLWKNTSIGKKWNSPWSKGRPGWHIECFVFIKKYFHNQLDIHGGGIDLKFPHHENENVICRSFFKKTLSNLWIHVGHVQMNNQKISKSQNNRLKVADLLKIYSPNFLRYVFLLNNYESPFNISEEKLKQFYEEWIQFEKTINSAKSILIIEDADHRTITTTTNHVFLSYWENNLNMPNVLTWLLNLKNQLLNNIKSKNITKIQTEMSLLIHHLNLLGFEFINLHIRENIKILKEWKQAIDLKDYSSSDFLRKKLQELNLII